MNVKNLVTVLLCALVTLALHSYTAKAATGGIFNDGTLVYHVLTESGTTGTAEVVEDGYNLTPRTYMYYGDIVIPKTVVNAGITYTVTTISTWAFESCGVTSVSIPDSVTAIRDYAFRRSSLSSIEIPSSVQSIGLVAFARCKSLTQFTVDERNTAYKDIDGVLFNYVGTTLIQYPAYKPDTEYAAPNSVVTIGHSAFTDCAFLESISLPSVTSIGYSAFEFSKPLVSVNMPSVVSINSGAFMACESLASVHIPDTMTSIGSNTFGGCKSLKSIEMPASVTSIGRSAFAGCEALTSLSLSGVSVIESSAFDSCISLASIAMPVVTSIGDTAFAGCNSLVSVEIPASTTSIGSGPFAGCKSLVQITVDEGNEAYRDIDGVLFTHGSSTLAQYPAGRLVSSYAVPDFVNTIADGSAGCTAIVSVDIPASVTYIGDNAFTGCTSLSSVYFEGNAPSLASYAFPDFVPGLVLYYPVGSTGYNGDDYSSYTMATYTPYILTVTNGTGSGAYRHGRSVAIAANVLSGMAFDHWTTSDGGTFGDANSANTTFTMPASATMVTAVPAEEIPVSDITISSATGGTGISLVSPSPSLQLIASVEPEDATDKRVSWSTLDSNIATVDENGLVTAVAPGHVTIRATAMDGSNVSATIGIDVYYFEGSGTADDPYIIKTADELSCFASLVNQHTASYQQAIYALTTDIDISSIANWQTIGDAVNAFSGVFDGKGLSISGLKQNVNKTGNTYGGLFGRIEGATIRNLGITDFDIHVTTTNGNGYAGGIVGYAGTGSTIANCSSSGSIDVASTISAGSWKGAYAGGIAGYMMKESAIRDCHNSATIQASVTSNLSGTQGRAGGIAGYADAGYDELLTIEDCYNTGAVSASSSSDNSYSSAGGIAGLANGMEIRRCNNSGTILASNASSGACKAGGITGDGINGTVADCHNSGTVLGRASSSGGYTGGIVGYLVSSTIDNCYNEAPISAPANSGAVGAIAGYLQGGTISNCYNTGNMTLGAGCKGGGIAGSGLGNRIINCANAGDISGLQVGGIVGWSEKISIYNSYNVGDITATYAAGGMIGMLTGMATCEIRDCYNTGLVNGGDYAGGIAGYALSDLITLRNCLNAGQILGGTYAGGIVGMNATVISNCYYLDTISQGVGWGNKAGYPVSFEQIMLQETFTGFAFDTTWSMAGENHFLELQNNNQFRTVLFNSNGGSAIATKWVEGTSAIPEPIPPTKTGYRMDGWYWGATQTSENRWDFNTDAVDGNIVLSAKWIPGTYTVSFDSQGGSTFESIEVTYQSPYGSLPTPMFDEYSFNGWYTSPGGTGTKITDSTIVTVADDHTLYAGWMANTYTVAISASSTDYGTVSGGGSYRYGTSVTVNATPKTGYRFVRWLEGSIAVSTSPSYTFTVTNARTLEAEFVPISYAVTLSTNNTSYGTVSGGGSFDYGTSVTVNATAETGYRFVRWLEGSIAVSTSPSYTFTVTNARTLEAEFVPISYAVTLSTNNTSYGTVSGGGSFDYGTSVTVNATPKTGYRFVRWLEGSIAVSTSPSYTFTVTNARTLEAEFVPISYAVTLSTNNTSYGSVSGGGSFDYGTSVTVKAMPKAGYRFICWVEGSTAVSNSAIYTFTVTKARTLEAEFVPISYAVTLSTNNTSYGSVSGGGSFNYGTSVMVNAMPKTGYRFVRWLEGNTAVSTATSYTFTVTKARMLKAEFVPISYAVTVSASNTAYGSVSGGGSFNYGTSITLKATPRAGCQFMCWQEGNIVVSTSANYTFTVTKNRTLKAEFARLDAPAVQATAVSYNSVKVTWSAVSGAGGYEVWRSTSSGSGYTLAATVPGTSATNTGLATGTTYYYKVRAYRTVNGVKVYGAYSSVVSAKPMLAATTGLKVTATTYNSVKLTWTATAGAGGYEVWRSTKAASGYLLAATVAGTIHTNTGLATGTTYHYKVRAYRTVSGVKVYGAYSSVVSAKPILAATTGLKVTSTTYNSVKLTWTATTGAGGYEVWRSTKAASGYLLAATVGGTTSTNTGLATGTTYYYKVRAYRTVNGTKVYGGYSSVVSAKPSLTTPTGVKAARASATSIKVSWAAVAGAMKYELWRATSSDGTYYKLPDTTTPSYTNTGLTTGKTYYYKVRAYRTMSGVKVYGGYSAAVYAKP